MGFAICCIVSVLIVAGLVRWDGQRTVQREPKVESGPLQSPFRNSLAFVRFEDEYDQSVAPMVLQGYSPYFHTVHLSQGDWEAGATIVSNITHDFFKSSTVPYAPFARVAQALLDDPNIASDGMLFFKDTSWIRPLAFSSDVKRMWMLNSPDSKCFSGIGSLGQMSDDDEANVAPRLAVKAANVAREMASSYIIDANGWCSG